MGFISGLIGGSTGANFSAQGSSGAPTAQTVSNATNAAGTQLPAQNDLAAQAAQQNGFANQSSVFSQQQALAGQLGTMAQGGGPNPALDQLNQTTGQNIASQASLMAGQRGASQNTGLIARQSAQQGAATQQQAVGQAATLRSQQQLNAISALQQQQGLLSNTANTQVQNQIGTQQNATNAALQYQGNLLGAQQSTNQVNAQIALANQKAQQGLIGGVLGSFGSGVATLAKGGIAGDHAGMPDGLNYADGGPTYNKPTPVQQDKIQSQAPVNGPQSMAGRALQGFNSAQGSENPVQSGTQSFLSPMLNKAIQSYIKPSTPIAAKDYGSNSPTSDLSTYGSESDASAAIGDDALAGAGEAEGGGEAADLLLAADGGQIDPYTKEDPTTIGGTLSEVMDYLGKGGPALNLKGGTPKVPGKAKVKGDSLKNDTVPAMLSPGEGVIPRTHMTDPKKAAAFAAQMVLRNKSAKPKGKK